jgi:two-component system NtrC family sensor kinase
LVVRRASDIIREQTRTINEAKANAEQYAAELERRVEERTTELRHTLAQQRHDEKMVAMGTLAAGLAHELNTPLGTILGSTQLVLDHCLSRLQDVSDAEHLTSAPGNCRQCVEDLSRVQAQARRCREIIRNLVDFSRKSDEDRNWEDLAELTERSLSLLDVEVRKSGIRVETVIDEELPPLLVNASDMQQVLVNVLNNAIVAMPNGGRLTVRLSRGDQTARIEISDTGIGIEEAILPRIFEPFFTTKGLGNGTGLGLWISYRIVKDHGGSISVSSVPGQGSTFLIELPMNAPGDDGGLAAEPVQEESNSIAPTRHD